MTGQEHYLEGEKSLAAMAGKDQRTVTVLLAEAQAHFTAALAAATALYDADFSGGDDAEYQAWKKIAGTQAAS